MRTLILLSALLGMSGGAATPSGDVTAHGARGDGVADDTDALRKALAAKAGPVRLPRGTYRLTKTLEIHLDEAGFTAIDGGGVARIVMAGPGPAFRLVGTHAGTAAPRTVKDAVWARERTPSITGLEIVGDHAEACGVEASGTMQLSISRLSVRRCLHAIHLVKRNRNVQIDGCHLYDNKGVGVYYDDVNLHQSNIVGCHISYNAAGGVVSRKGDVRNIQITGCDIEGNSDTEGAANVLLDSAGTVNGVGEVAITGCTIQHGREGKGGANIRILGRSLPTKDMPIVRQGHVTITGNVLSDVQVNIHLKGCRGVTLTGNTLWEGYTHNLLIEDCHSVVMAANSLDRNPHYGRYGKAKEARNTVVFRGCEDCTITALHVTLARGGPGLSLAACRRMNLAACSVLDCAEGVLLDGCHDCLLTGLMVRGGKSALEAKGGAGNVVSGVLAGAVKADKASTRVIPLTAPDR